MKKFDKKGFTIVELVIVIAVIAILAGIMIPTFSNVTETAKKAAVEAKAAEAYKNAMALDMADGYQDYNVADADLAEGFTYEDGNVSYTDGEYTVYFYGNAWNWEPETPAETTAGGETTAE